MNFMRDWKANRLINAIDLLNSIPQGHSALHKTRLLGGFHTKYPDAKGRDQSKRATMPISFILQIRTDSNEVYNVFPALLK